MTGLRALSGPRPLVGVLVLAAAVVAGCGGGNAEASKPSNSPQVTATPSATRTESPASTPATSQDGEATPAAAQSYEVQPGDTPGDIAERFYNDRSEWQRIYDANRDVIGDDPDAIAVGMQLKIPPGP